MSNAIFPAIPGLTWDIKRRPHWQTKVQRSVGGKEIRAAFYANPIWEWDLSFDFLHADSRGELQTLQAFFLQRQGSFDSFLWSDPQDNAVTAHGFGVGDGATTAFQLQRCYLGTNQQDYWSGLKTSQYTTPRTNLLPHSDFSTWANSGASVAPTVAPDGTMGATRLVYSATAYPQMVYSTIPVVSGQTYTMSVWMKQDAVGINMSLASNGGNLSLTTSVLSTGKWQRLTATATATATGNANIVLTMDTSGASVSGAGSAYAPQTEVGSVATPYIPTTTAAVTVTPNYWPKGGDGFEPIYNLNPATPLQVYRSDWQGNQLMYQTARTNQITYASTYTSGWTTTGAPTIAANATAAPDGTNTASNWARTTTAASYEYQAVTKATTALPYTMSIYAKQNTGRYLALRMQGTFPARADVVFDLQLGTISVAASVTGAFTNASASITPMPNGFYRCSLSATTDTANSVQYLWSINSNAVQADGVDSSSTSSGYAWGAQLEAGSTLTSYIPTTTAAVTVTDYSVNGSGLVTFSNAPLTGAVLTWTGAYYWRVRFAQDMAEFNNFVQNLWDLKSLNLVGVK